MSFPVKKKAYDNLSLKMLLYFSLGGGGYFGFECVCVGGGGGYKVNVSKIKKKIIYFFTILFLGGGGVGEKHFFQ